MQNSFDPTFFSSDRGVLSGSLLAVIGFYAAIIVIVLLALTSTHSGAGVATGSTSSNLDPLATGMPLP